MGKNRRPGSRKDQPSGSQAPPSQGGGSGESDFPPLVSPARVPAPAPQQVSPPSSRGPQTPAVRSVGHPGQSGSSAPQGAYPRPSAPAAQASVTPGPFAPEARPSAYPGPPASAVRPSATPRPSAPVARPSATPGPSAPAARRSAYSGPHPPAVRPSASPGPHASAARPSAFPGPSAPAARPSAAHPPLSASTALSAGTSGPSGSAPRPNAPSAGPSLSRELEQKLTLQPPTPAPVQAQTPPTSSKAFVVPRRPGFGTAGRKCVVRANHFLVEVADKNYYHYDVSITPEVTSKVFNRKIIQQLVDLYRESNLGGRRLAYDGRKSFYTAGQLPFESQEFAITIVDDATTSKPSSSKRRDRQFKVVIKYATQGDFHHLKEFLQGRQLDCPYDVIQVLDVVLRAGPSTRNTPVGRHFVSPNMGRGDLGDGVEYWRGYYQSIRPAQIGLSLNIDLTARSFYEAIFVTDFIAKHFNFRDMSRPLSDQDRLKVKKALRGVKVEISHREYCRSYKISGISQLPANKLMFTLDDKKTQISVVQYFDQKYSIKLKYPSLPALQAGSDTKPVYLPMELCKIAAGQRYTKKLNERQVTALLKATCTRPAERERDINSVVGKINNYDDDDLVKEFGITVKRELATIEARVLPPPRLKYHQTGREANVDPSMGQWNMINKKMVNGGRVEAWTCISFSTRLDRDFPHVFSEQLVDMCRSKGMDFNPKPLIPIRCADPRQIERTLHDIHKESTAELARLRHTQKQLQLLIIVLPDGFSSYAKIKRTCETELGIVTQCCNPKQAMKLSKQYFENIALKMNVKVGGRNTVLDAAINKRIPYVTDKPTIIFGADVTHPMPGDDSSPSIAAVVASMDWPEVTKYRCLVSSQTHRDEIIDDLYQASQDQKGNLVHKGMIRELLIAFKKSTGLKPARIIFYRDGVSEGQFSQVLLHEMIKIREACASLEQGYLPPVTFVVVQKRHHTRFFPENHGRRDTTDKSGNILPGTVVDTKICHPSEFDFYLNSHAGIQGTSRPAHYHVLYDENNFTADGLQTLTNNLCYTYARCTRSVSIVPPAYYAHLGAFRARYYIESEISDAGSSSGGRGGPVEIKQLPTIKDNIKDVMFYC